MSRSSNWIVLSMVVVVGLFGLSALHEVEGVQCYICSWSPGDSAQRIDVCTRKNFNESYVRTHSCEAGCESVTVFDKNGRLDFFYRNCADNSSVITGNCLYEKTKAITKEICNCNTNYCNSMDLGNTGTMDPMDLENTGTREQYMGLFLTSILALLMTKL